MIVVLCAALMIASDAQAFQGAPASPVRVNEVKLESVQNQQMVTGELRAVHRSRVASEESGVVEKLLVLEGQTVEAGEVLAVLDSKRLEIELAQADADLSVAQSLVKEREADAAKARDDAESLRTVFAQRAANAKELRDAEADLRIAEARLAWAMLAVKVEESKRELVAKRLSDMSIVAPYDGVVVARHVEVGEWLAEGDPIVDLISTGSIEAWLNVPQWLYSSAGAKNLAVAVKIEATEEVLSSKAKRVIPMVDARARTFTLIVTLPNHELGFAPGMSVVAWVPMGDAEERMTVASDAIMRNENGAFVYAVRQAEANGPMQAIPVKVSVLHPHGSRFVIDATGELAAGEKVVVEGNERLFPFAAVSPVDMPVVSSRDGERGAME